jgi:6-phosphogluconolactonase
MSHFVIVCNSGSSSFGLYGLSDSGKLEHAGDMPFPGIGEANGACPIALSRDGKTLYLAFRGNPQEVLSFAIDGKARQLQLLGRAPLADSMAHIAVDSSGRYLLSASYGGGKVSINPIEANGAAGAPSDTLTPAAKMHCCIPVPGSDVFFATSLAADTIYRFRIGAGGKLEQQNETAKMPGGPRHVVLHPNGRFAYVVTELSSLAGVFELEGGTLSPEPVQTLSILPEKWQGEPWAADIRITPDGRFLYASDRKANSIACFKVDAANGRLTRAGETFGAPWPRSMNITPDGRFLLALGENSDLIDVFGIDAETGALDKRHTLPTGKGPSWVEVVGG